MLVINIVRLKKQLLYKLSKIYNIINSDSNYNNKKKNNNKLQKSQRTLKYRSVCKNGSTI